MMKHKKSLTVQYEQKKAAEGYAFVIGCDEVGRGCLAGPVVAAAVILKQVARSMKHETWFHEIQDSKVLSPSKRQELDGLIRMNAHGWGIGVVEPHIIDKINIHQASLLAMRRAVEKLMVGVSCESSASPGIFVTKNVSNSRGEILNAKSIVAIDGKFSIPEFHMQQEAVVNGDAKILSIAAASILAKVYRDRLMKKLDTKYPGYNFSVHKGYATELHRAAIRSMGLSSAHRLSFCGKYL